MVFFADIWMWSENEKTEDNMLLGQILLREGKCSESDIMVAHTKQMVGEKKMIGEILVDLGIIESDDLTMALIKQRKALIGAKSLLLANKLRRRMN